MRFTQALFVFGFVTLQATHVAAELPNRAVDRFGSPALRHGERPLSLALDAEGKRLVSGGPDGVVKLWDTATGQLLGSYKVKDGYASSVALTPDGAIIAARFGDNLVHILDAKTMKRTRAINVPNVETIALSADGKLLAGTTPQGKLHVFEVENGLERLQPLAGRAMAFTPNGARIARAETGEVLRITDVVSGESTFTCTHLSQDGVTSLAWSADGESLLSADAGATGRVRVWQLNQQKPVAEWVANGGFAIFANDHVVGLNDKKVNVWDKAGKAVRTFGTNVSVVAVSGDGKVAATAGPEPRIAIWDTTTGKQRWTEPDDLGIIRDLVGSASGEVFVAAERGVASWKPGEKPKILVTTPPSSHVVVGDQVTVSIAEGKLSVWEKAPVKTPSRTIDLGKATPLAATLSLHDNRVFVSFDDKTLKEFDTKTGQTIRSWSTPSTVPAMAVSQDGEYLIGIGRDGFARSWRLFNDPPEARWSLRVARSLRPGVAISWNAQYAAVTSVVRVDVFESLSVKRLFYGERTWNDGPFQAVTFSHDGRFVAAGMQGSAGGVTVWEVATGSHVARFEGGCGSVTKLLFLPDYRLISASVDDNLLAWELVTKRKTPPRKAELQAAWDKLADPSGEVGFAAEQVLAQGGNDAWEIMNAGVNKVRANQKTINSFIKNLGHAEFAKREDAMKGLRDLGMIAVPAVAALVTTSSDAEVVQRAEKLVAEFAKKGFSKPLYGLYADELRIARTVAALEQLNSPLAEQLLERMQDLPGSDGAFAARKRMKAKR